MEKEGTSKVRKQLKTAEKMKKPLVSINFKVPFEQLPGRHKRIEKRSESSSNDEYASTPNYAEDARLQREEELRAEAAGEKTFPKNLWNKMKNPPTNRPTIDLWEFKPEGELMTMTFVCEGEKFPMWFSPRSTPDYPLRPDIWIPRSNPIFKTLRTRLYSLPKTLTINKIVFHSTPQCEVEDCVIEFMFLKKWTCRQFEYTIGGEFTQPQHLRKLIHMLKPIDISVVLNYGQFQSPVGDTNGFHNHLGVDLDNVLYLEKDFRSDCVQALNTATPDTNRIRMYSEAGKGKIFASQMLKTLVSIRKFVSMMCEKKMAQTKGMAVRKFVVSVANSQNTSDKICPKLHSLQKEEGIDETNKKRASFANGDKIFVCVRNDYRRARYSLSMPSTAFKMNVGNEQLLVYTKSVPNFQCFFRTTVDETAVQTIIQEWLKNDRNIEEIQLHLDKVFEPNFCSQFNPDMSDPKKIKIRKNINDKRSTMYIERERLATRHLALRVYDVK